MPVSYFDWAPQEPDNSYEDVSPAEFVYLSGGHDGKWADGGNDRVYGEMVFGYLCSAPCVVGGDEGCLPNEYGAEKWNPTTYTTAASAETKQGTLLTENPSKGEEPSAQEDTSPGTLAPEASSTAPSTSEDSTQVTDYAVKESTTEPAKTSQQDKQTTVIIHSGKKTEERNIRYSEEIHQKVMNYINTNYKGSYGKRFRVMGRDKDFFEASNICRNAEGVLPCISNIAQQFSAKSINNATAWLGVIDYYEEGSYECESGEPISFTNWAVSQPDNRCGEDNDADFTFIAEDGTWVDCGSNEHWRYKHDVMCAFDCQVSFAPGIFRSTVFNQEVVATP